MQIENFEIKKYSFTVSGYKDGRQIKHEYHDAPKSVILKILEAKSAPTFEDVAGWMRDWEHKNKKSHQNGCPVDVPAAVDYWSK